MSQKKIMSLWAACIMTVLGLASFTAMAENVPGSLTLIGSTPPVSNAGFQTGPTFTPSGQYAYIPDGGNPAYAGSNTILIYNVDSNGMLTPHTPASASVTGHLAMAGNMLISPSGQYAYVTSGRSSNSASTCTIYSFFIDNAGNLTPLTNTNASTASGCSNDLAFAASGKYLYMAYNFLGPTGFLNTYSVGDYDGNLTLVNSIVTYRALITIPSDGKFAYLQNANAVYDKVNNTISMYSVEPITGQLIPLDPGSITLPTSSAVGTTFDPSNKYLYVTNPADNTILIYAKNKGLLTLLGQENLAPGYAPGSVIVSKTGYIYVYSVNRADQNVRNISAYHINEATGQLTAIDTIPAPMTPIDKPNYYLVSMSTNPSGTNLYLDVAQFSGQQGRALASQTYVYKINGVL